MIVKVVAVAVTLVGVVVGSMVASASCFVPHESAEYVVAKLRGEQVGEGLAFANPGDVLAVVERQTVLIWEAIPTHSTASATVIVRYWGDPPDSTFEPVIDGGEPTAQSATTTSCEPSTARSLGDRELGVVFSLAGYTPLIEGEFTAEQESAFAENLGREIVAQPRSLPAEHPMTGTASETRSPAVLVVAALAGVGALALIAWWLMAWQRRPARDRT